MNDYPLITQIIKTNELLEEYSIFLESA